MVFDEKSNATWNDCHVQYIGETGRALETRKREHVRSVTQENTEQSALAEHVKITGHNVYWENMRAIVKESRWCQRRWSEACMIFRTEGAIANRDCGRTLPHVYRPLNEKMKKCFLYFKNSIFA